MSAPTDGMPNPEGTHPERPTLEGIDFALPNRDLLASAQISRTRAGLGGMAIAVSGIFTTMAQTPETASMIVAGTAAAAAFGGVELNRRHEKLSKAHLEFQKQLGERVEIYGAKGRERILRWHIDPDTEGGSDNLYERMRRVAYVADTHGIRRMAIDPRIIDHLTDEQNEHMAYVLGTRVDNLKEQQSNIGTDSWTEEVTDLKNNLHLSDSEARGNDVTLTPDDPENDRVWRVHTAELLRERKERTIISEEDKTPAEDRIGKLHSLRPGNIVSRVYAEFAAEPALQREQTLRAIEDILSKELQETVVETNAFGQMVKRLRTAEVPAKDDTTLKDETEHQMTAADHYIAHEARRRQLTADDFSPFARTQRTGKIMGGPHEDGTRVRWTQGQEISEQDTYEALGFADTEIVDHLIENPQDMPKDAWRILLASAYIELLKEDPNEGAETKRQIKKTLVTFERPEHAPARYPDYQAVVPPHIKPIPFELGKQRLRQLKAAAATGAVTLILGGAFITGLDVLAGATKDGAYKAADAGEAGSDEIMSGIGNIDGTQVRNSAKWKLETHGLTAVGYWTQSTSSDYANGQWYTTNFGHNGSHDIPASLDTQKYPSYIKVDSTNEGIRIDPTIAELGNGVKVPVKDDTQIVAATVNGEEAAHFNAADGTDILMVKDHDKWKEPVESVTYWLAPSGMPAPNEYADGDLQPFNPIAADEVKVNRAKSLSREWAQKAPGVGTSAIERAHFMRNAFEYDLQPLDRPAEDYGKDLNRFVNDVLTKKEAVCNVAATVIALSNPEVSYASGFLIEKEDAKSLNRIDMHAFNLTADGTIIDGTPIQDSDGDSHSFFTKEVYQQEEPEETKVKMTDVLTSTPTKIAGGLLAALALGHAVSRRKQIAKSVKRAGDKAVKIITQPEKKRAKAEQTVRAARPMIDFVLFSKNPTLPKALDVITSGKYASQIDYKLADHLRSRSTGEAVRRLESDLSLLPEDQRRKARRTVRRVSKAIDRLADAQ